MLDPVEQPMPDYAADQADMAAAVDYGTSSEDVYTPTDNPYASASLSAPEMGGGAMEEPDMAGAATETVSSETGEETIKPLAMETGDTSALEPATNEMAGATTAAPGVSEHHRQPRPAEPRRLERFYRTG